MVKVREDLTGRIFGRLVVIEQAEDYVSINGQHQARWLCQCECGSDPVIVWGKHLKNQHTLSCGCYHSQRVAEEHKKYNRYEFCGDYVVGYTSKDEPFYLDLDDYEKVYNICWYIDEEGYVIGKLNDKLIKMHRYITNCPSDMVVDHIGGYATRCDNRKLNLRICTPQENARNHKLNSRNKSNYTGVGWDKKRGRWYARLQINGKYIWKGFFANINDAIYARQKLEEEEYGEYAYASSQKYYKERLDEYSR